MKGNRENKFTSKTFVSFSTKMSVKKLNVEKLIHYTTDSSNVADFEASQKCCKMKLKSNLISV